MEHTLISDLINADSSHSGIIVKGWVRTTRAAKDITFIELNDGSHIQNLQVIADPSLPNYEEIRSIPVGSSVSVTGDLVPSPAKGQSYELRAKEISIYGSADPGSYPLQKKRHSFEFLRDIAHLRPRTTSFGAVFRLRSELSFAIHDFFRTRGFFYVHTPIITASDCEGAGEMFQVTTLDLDKLPIDPETRKIDYKQDFFGRAAKLTVSGQLEAETHACALGNVYTFGP
ncbi:MAG TPA: OB-fold nucleic acid binding domain-containing protein, partial [Spirochaetota bacterium]|nr:OB-fold nucleic acid binding domain-containing protein [Spirochaetota bacterium]